MSETRRTGEIAETALRSWAAQVGASATKADPDRTGWDFIVEFPFLTLEQVDPLDEVRVQLQTFIQVKGTEGRSKTFSVKLSNMLYLIRSPLPCFFLRVHVTNGQVTNAYLIHIDERIIRRTLRRLRLLSKSIGVKELGKRSMRISYDAVHSIDDLTGVGLAEKLRDYISGDNETYASWKIELLRSAGYEEGRYEFDVTLLLPTDRSPAESLVDFALGLLDEGLPTVDATGWNIRFGERAPGPDRKITGRGRLEIKREPAGKGRLIIDQEDSVFELPVDLYVPSGVAHLVPEDHFKILAESELIKVVLQPSSRSGSISLKAPTDQLFKIAELEFWAVFVERLFNGSLDVLQITMDTPTESSLGRIERPRIPTPPAEWLELARVTRALTIIVREILWMGEIDLYIDELARQADALLFLAAVIRNKHEQVRIEGYIGGSLDPDRRTMIPLARTLKLGDHLLSFVVLFIGYASCDAEGKVTLETQTAQLFRHKKSMSWPAARIDREELLDSLVRTWESEYNVVLFDWDGKESREGRVVE